MLIISFTFLILLYWYDEVLKIGRFKNIEKNSKDGKLQVIRNTLKDNDDEKEM